MSPIQQGTIENDDSPAGGLRFVVALKPEADSVIEFFDLKPVTGDGPFRCWKNETGNVWLVMTGIEKTAAAAGAAWLHSVSGASSAAAWINIGIAGHPSLEPGELRRVHKITDAGSGRSWYPPLVVGGNGKIESANLITVDRPAKKFPDADSLVDMEASGFVEMASRLTSLELVACFKVVSDNAETGFEGLKGNRGRIRELTMALVQELETSEVFDAFCEVSANEADRLADPPGYQALISQVHFSESHRHQLRRLLQRRNALGLKSNGLANKAADARSILKSLELELSATSA